MSRSQQIERLVCIGRRFACTLLLGFVLISTFEIASIAHAARLGDPDRGKV